jgi:hypothetical protein
MLAHISVHRLPRHHAVDRRPLHQPELVRSQRDALL